MSSLYLRFCRLAIQATVARSADRTHFRLVQSIPPRPTMTHWMLLSLLSAVFLGIYALAKKAAVHENAVPPVLLLNVLTAGLLYLPVMIVSAVKPVWINDTALFVEPLTIQQHGLLFLKSALVGASWTFAFYGLKHLPLSIATPIRSTSPFWTIAIAVTFLQERPTTVQWCGIALIVGAFFAFSVIGKQEGINFRRNRWVMMMLIATLLGSFSSLYDKHLLQTKHFSPATVQAWFSIYLCVVLFPLAARWYVKDRTCKPFEFRWAIPAIAVTLLIADFAYFTALADPSAQIALISPLRRTSILVPFVFGIVCLKEKSPKPKAVCIACMLIGVALLR